MGKVTASDGPSSNTPYWGDEPAEEAEAVEGDAPESAPHVGDLPVQDLDVVDLGGDAREVIRKAMSETKPSARTRVTRVTQVPAAAEPAPEG